MRFQGCDEEDQEDKKKKKFLNYGGPVRVGGAGRKTDPSSRLPGRASVSGFVHTFAPW